MKRNRKGFSLVELIVVLVIMAIIAALCAPNISAYVQAAKVQNYQTVANNLADELQTQLPQSRYWNWDEVQRNAYGILCADAGRGVTLDTEKSTDNQKVYQITGASSDANAVFTVTLTYHDAVKTSQKVDIAVSCDGYAAVQSVQECNLVLKTNYTDASAYAMSSTTITTTETKGWGNLDDRVNTKSYWEEWGKTHPENDFTKDATWSGWWTPDTTIVNLTDYVSNSCKFVQFDMPYFCGYHQTNGEYAGSYAFPSMYSLNGAGDGAQYAVTSYSDGSESTWEKIYIYIGDDNNTEDLNFIDKDADGNEIYDSAAMYDHGWVKYSDIFANGRGNFRTDGNPDYISAFQNKYDSSITVNPDSTFVNNTKIKYRVLLRTNSGEESSRGWLYVEGTYAGIGKKCSPEKKNFLVYANNGSQLNDFSDRYEVDKQSWNTSIYMDVSKCGYSVGNQLSITIHNVDADKLIDSMENGRAGDVSVGQNKSYDGYDGVKYGSIQPKSFIYGKPENGGNYWAEKPDASDNSTARIVIVMTYSRYPYLKLEFLSSFWTSGATSTDVDISLKMDYSGGNSSESTIDSYTPMLTLNGDSTYTNITLDWTKCDYITNAGEVGVKFVKYPSTLNYDVYSKDYTLLAPDQNLKTFMMNSNSAVTSAASADKIVHLYCKGVSPEEIQCEIVAPKNTATTTTTTTPPPPETETTAKTTTSKTTAATTTTTATTATTTTTTTTTTATTTTTTTTTAATTSTAATTATTATAATTTAETTASSTATTTTSATETTAATTTTSATTSTTISTTATTATTSTSATETSGGVVTSVIENASYNQEITIPNYKNIIAIDVVFENANNGGGEYIIYNNDSDAVRESYYINKNQLNLHIDVPGSDNGIVMYSKFKLTHWGDGNIKSITFVYRDTVPLEWLVDDGYTVQSKNEMATLNSNYEFTITWNKDTKNIPAVVANCDVISPKSSTESTATYSVPISQKTRISVVNGSAVTLDNVAFGEGIDLTQYNFESIYAVEIQVGDFTSTRGSFGGAIYEGGWENRKSISLSPSDWNDSLKVDYTVARNRLTIDGWNASLKKVVLYFNRPSAATAEQIVIHKMMRNDPVSMFLVNSSEHQTVTSTTTLQTTAPQTTTTTTTTTTTPPIAASENGKNVGLDESSAAGCNITFSDPLFNDSGVCYFTITPKAGYTLSDSYTVKVGTEVLSAKNNYNAKTGQWFFWSNKIMTDYTIHVEGVSPAA